MLGHTKAPAEALDGHADQPDHLIGLRLDPRPEPGTAEREQEPAGHHEHAMAVSVGDAAGDGREDRDRQGHGHDEQPGSAGGEPPHLGEEHQIAEEHGEERHAERRGPDGWRR